MGRLKGEWLRKGMDEGIKEWMIKRRNGWRD